MALKKLGLFDDTQNNTNSLFDNIPTTPYSSMAVTIGPLRFARSFASGTDVHSGAHAGLASPAPELVAAVAPTDESPAAITISDYAVDTALNAYIAADTPAGSLVEVYGFNDAGAWGGAASGYPVGTNSAFIFNNGSATVINDPNGTNGTSLFGVSNNGDYAVGSYINSEGATSFYLDDAGVYTDISAELPTPDATDYIAGVNNSGEIAGFTETGSLAAQGFVVRVCPKSYLWLTKPSDHEPDRGPAQERQGVGVQTLPIFGQPAAAVQPTDGTLDDPAFVYHDKFLCCV